MFMKLQCGILPLQHTFTHSAHLMLSPVFYQYSTTELRPPYSAHLMLSTCQIRKDINCAINVTALVDCFPKQWAARVRACSSNRSP